MATGPGGTATATATLTVIAHTDDHTIPHPDDPTKRDEHLAAMAVTPVEGTTIIVKSDESFTLGPGQILNLQPRAVPRDKVNDPLDFSGGIVSHGTVSIVGTPKLPKAVPVSPIKAGDTVLTFAVPLDGWQVGDELLVPGDARGQTEHPTIQAIDGLTVTLNAPAAFNHGDLYRGRDVSRTPAPPVCNMTRDAGVHGPEGVTNAERPHLMFMHSQKVSAKHASFKNLGRTDAAVTHTTPEVVDGQVINDENTIGRYAFHNHVRKGATWATLVPVEGCVFDGSPKHLLTNHGGGLVAKDCAFTRWSGSALFCENGSEIGAFIGNVAAGDIRHHGVMHNPGSRPPHYPVPPETKKTPEDLGFSGYGAWLQGGGVPLIDQYSADCQVGAAYFPQGIHDSGTQVDDNEWSHFLVENILPPEQYLFGRPVQPLHDTLTALEAIKDTDRFLRVNPAAADPAFIPCYIKNGKAVGCEIGLSMWATFAVATSIVDGYEAINCNDGVQLIYNKNAALYNVRAIRQDPTAEGRGYVPSSSCMAVNAVTSDIRFYNFVGEGYDYCGLPFRGDNKFIGAHFDNRYGPSVSAPLGGSLTMEGITLGKSIKYLPDAPYNVPEAMHKILLINEARVDFPPSEAFKSYTFLLEGQEIIHNCRMPSYVPFPNPIAGWEQVVGKTNRQLWDEFGWWVGGKEIPDVELVPHPLVFGGGTLP